MTKGEQIKREGLYCVAQINDACEKLADIVNSEMKKTPAIYIDMELVRKLQSIIKQIKEVL